MASSIFINNVNEFLNFMNKDLTGTIGTEWVKWKTVINYFLSKDENAFDCYKHFICNSNITGSILPEFQQLLKIIDDINNEVWERRHPKESQFCYDLWSYTFH
jgi:hypothetical protein